jgi:hypothetical protein
MRREEVRQRTSGVKAWCYVLLVWSAFLAAGCTRGRQVAVPDVSPSQAAKKALAEYDTNQDGYLDEGELARCPALKNSLEIIDKDGDHRLSADEIADRIAAHQASRVGLAAVVCQVMLDNKPLADVTVSFIPENFMGPNIRAASGTTDANGLASLQVQGKRLPGAHLGFFRVEVSKKNAEGIETIPAKYNANTVLGQEIAPDILAKSGTILLRLSS